MDKRRLERNGPAPYAKDVDDVGSWQMETELRLRIVLVAPPAGVDFGLQDGKGSDYRTIQKQRSRGADLSFDCTVTVSASDPVPIFDKLSVVVDHCSSPSLALLSLKRLSVSIISCSLIVAITLLFASSKLNTSASASNS